MVQSCGPDTLPGGSRHLPSWEHHVMETCWLAVALQRELSGNGGPPGRSVREAGGLGPGAASRWSAWLVRRPEGVRQTFIEQGHQIHMGIQNVLTMTSQPVGERWVIHYLMSFWDEWLAIQKRIKLSAWFLLPLKYIPKGSR